MVKNNLKHKRILITSGPVWVPIDDVRIISNRSSGRLGKILAQEFRKKGADVCLLEGPVGAAPRGRPLSGRHRGLPLRILKFYFFDEFLNLLKKEIRKNYDIVIHAAAVSDYQLKKPFKHKLSSRLRSLKLELVPTAKIINLIKKTAPRVFLVGFKLESALTKKNVYQNSQRLFEEAQCDLVVANCVNKEKYHAYILDKETILAQASSREELARKLIKVLDL